MSHIYIHFPYCLYKCHYCDFNSHAYDENKIPHEDYVQALLSEIQKRSQKFKHAQEHFFANQTSIKSIFFGGGTPSLMHAKHVEIILNELQKHFVFTSDCEITLETNPGTIDLQKFLDFKKAGINRISLGIQSFYKKNLERFGRIHTAEQAHVAIQSALKANFKSVSGDLIFGFPDQDFTEWQSDLENMLQYNLSHLSCYSLTAEPGTQYTEDLKVQKYKSISDELSSQMFVYTHDVLDKKGLKPYEISNFAKSGYESQHNLSYWHYKSYLGLGAGAYSNFFYNNPQKASFLYRTINIKSPQSYIKSVQTDDFFRKESIDKTTSMFEFLMMGLRLKSGISFGDFRLCFGEDLQKVFEVALQKNREKGYLKMKDERVFPTKQGYLYHNQMIQEFL